MLKKLKPYLYDYSYVFLYEKISFKRTFYIILSKVSLLHVFIVNSNNHHKFNQAYVFYCKYSRMHLVAIIFTSGIYFESNTLDYTTQGL